MHPQTNYSLPNIGMAVGLFNKSMRDSFKQYERQMKDKTAMIPTMRCFALNNMINSDLKSLDTVLATKGKSVMKLHEPKMISFI